MDVKTNEPIISIVTENKEKSIPRNIELKVPT